MTYDYDYGLFLALNFDGGRGMDILMKLLTTSYTWLPLYGAVLYIVWRRWGWRRMLLFLAMLGLALGLSDMICGIFKHSGILKHLWPSFPPRLRPMYTEELLPRIHVPYPGGGRYGTVSAHAATNAAMLLLSAAVIRRRWFAVLGAVCFLLICYSRIYLAKHFPIDLLLGTAAGIVIGYALLALYRRAVRLAERKKKASAMPR